MYKVGYRGDPKLVRIKGPDCNWEAWLDKEQVETWESLGYTVEVVK